MKDDAAYQLFRILSGIEVWKGLFPINSWILGWSKKFESSSSLGGLKKQSVLAPFLPHKARTMKIQNWIEKSTLRRPISLSHSGFSNFWPMLYIHLFVFMCMQYLLLCVRGGQHMHLCIDLFIIVALVIVGSFCSCHRHCRRANKTRNSIHWIHFRWWNINIKNEM